VEAAEAASAGSGMNAWRLTPSCAAGQLSKEDMRFGTSNADERLRPVECMRAKTAESSADAQRCKPVMSGSVSLGAAGS